MILRFLGANRTVTGSCHLIEVNGKRIALDCGMFQGRRDEARALNEVLDDNLRNLDCIILSHGHLDHCGRLPILTAAGYTGPIYCTPATAAVARIVLEDAAEIQLEDADYLNRRERAPDEPPVRPLYTPAIARDTVRQFKTIPYARTTDLGNNIRFTFFDAGHILGSAWILLEWTEASHPRSLLFTADIGRHGTPIINDPVLPARPVDFVITESTYAGKTHAPMATAGHLLLECFQSIQQSRGRMIVPAFAVGRTQTILWYYARFVEDGLIDPFPVFVDSPMAVEVTHTYAGFPQFFDPETHALLTQQSQRKLPITLAGSSQQSREINSAKGPCLIIASSPTLEFGRVLHHVKISLERPQDLIAFVGWTPPYTLGRRIIEGQSRVRIFDRFYDVKCQRRTINGLSAHADGHELLAFLKPALAPHTRCFIVHGEPPRAEAMARLLHEAGATAIVPATQTCVIA